MTDPKHLPPLTDLPPGAHELDHWLTTATLDLCDGAKARVRAEVEAHFAAAYEDARNSGADADTAIAAACDQLGDAACANRRYRKVYLTASEARVVWRLSGTSAGAVAVCWAGVILWECAALQFGKAYASDRIGFLMQWNLVMLVVIAAGVTLAYHFAERPVALGWVNLTSSLVLPLALSGLLFLNWSDRADSGWNHAVALVPILAWWLFDAAKRLRLLAKLRNTPAGPGNP